MKPILLLIIIISTFTSCESVTTSNKRLLSLYRQRIPHSRYVMYEFNISGYMAFNGDNHGYAILDSSQTFSEDKTDEINANYINGELRLDSLQMIYLYSPGDRVISTRDTLMIPTVESNKKYNGIPISVRGYQSTYGVPVNWTPGGNEFTFDSFKETGDSLFLYGIKKTDNYGIELPITKGFIKGNIKLVDSAKGLIDHIEIKKFIIKRDDVYKFGGRDSILKNQPVVDMIYYDFFPKKSTSTSSFSDIGIYKRLK